ncbi:PREDICTED: heavy metal-associated isoprenylated plant protein 3-like [Camelina sativa]|uniref:Heavy metal-associated isoprenylated plant protein 3-like n=1 Tax=Camelina sativa TaxID=90675 RepID=A0ABM0X3W3_CAMSA|nr:PREDICTED: heavy metal-associated isoprenylated plant protein 3-like [Camelina sativa]
MATEEMKSETKKTEQKQKQSPQIKQDLPPSTIPPLPLPYKSCSLKVSIHCEGCKRKVKKILTSIDGVYKVDIDVSQHRVTVIGIVSPEILLKKLHKAGKNAELVPEEIPDLVENKPKPVDPNEKNKNKKKEERVQITTDEATSSVTDKPEKTDAGKCDNQVSEKTDAKECGSGDGGENAPVKEEKKDVVKQKDTVKEESPSPPADSPAPAGKKVEETGGAGNGKVGKKKKNIGQNLSAPNNPTGGPTRSQSLPPPATEDHDRSINQINVIPNNNPPRHDMYLYPAPNYYAPQVMYGVSYNVAQPPLSADAASYYTPPPPYSYAYMHNSYQPSDQNAYPSRPSDSFELFSDENPNGCSVM